MPARMRERRPVRLDGLGLGPPSSDQGELLMSADTAFFVTQAEQA